MALVTPQGIKLTYEDYVQIPDDGRRHEILDGVHCVSAAPVPYHQQVTFRIAHLLAERFFDTGRAEILLAPIDVELSPVDIVQPDVLVVLEANAAIIGKTRLVGAPDLVVEVLSPSTQKQDREVKKERYALGGVPEYWIVDPQARVVERFVLEEGRYGAPERFETEIASVVLPDTIVNLTRVW